MSVPQFITVGPDGYWALTTRPAGLTRRGALSQLIESHHVASVYGIDDSLMMFLKYFLNFNQISERMFSELNILAVGR